MSNVFPTKSRNRQPACRSAETMFSPARRILTDASVPLRTKLSEAGRMLVTDQDLIREVFLSLADSPCYSAYYRAAMLMGASVKLPRAFSTLEVDARAAEDITLAEFMLLLRREPAQVKDSDRNELLGAVALLSLHLSFTEDADERNMYYIGTDCCVRTKNT